ncbi:MAG: DUF115 domain-containing protein [Agathobacter sp.]|nr:DUF115 domain-containing protein [Agathobacter sp.]
MNIEIRKALKKNKFIYNLGQRVLRVNCKNYYNKLNKSTDNLDRIKALRNSHKNERCFIVGNGPSLTMEDLDLIKNEDCFAANLIYRIFDKTEWRPKYYVLIDRYADTGNTLDTLNLPYLFIGDYYWKHRGMKNANAICIHPERSIGSEKVNFSENIEEVVYGNYTVTHVMIQLAVYMGYKEIYLLGMDHSYALTYDKDGNVIEDNNVKSHIFEDKNPKDVIADIEGMNKAYIACRNYADTHSIKIVNVTRGGKLEWFPRLALEEALK